MAHDDGRGDDRVLPATRWTAGIVAVVLATAGVILYGFPTRTPLLWAWEINPPTTAMAVGAGYAAGATFFVRAFRSRRWHEVGLAFVAATVLSSMLLVATLLHWENFSHGHVSFWAWIVVYTVAPWLLPLLWSRNRDHDPGDAVDAKVVPDAVRRVVGAVGVAQVGASLAFFVRPSLAMAWWPWSLSPLTTRTLGAFLAFVGVVWLAFLFERRWSALRLHVESATLGLVLVGLALPRSPADLTLANPVGTAVLALLGGVVIGAVVLLVAMNRTAAG